MVWMIPCSIVLLVRRRSKRQIEIELVFFGGGGGSGGRVVGVVTVGVCWMRITVETWSLYLLVAPVDL